MENGTSVEIIKKGSWLNREYQVQTQTGNKLYSIVDEVTGSGKRYLLKDSDSKEVGSLMAGAPGIPFSFSYKARLEDAAEEKIELRHSFGKRIYEFSKYGLRCEKKFFPRSYDIFDKNCKLGRIVAKSGKYILEFENSGDIIIPVLFFFMTIRECEQVC